jgi:hypothetical protein
MAFPDVEKRFLAVHCCPNHINEIILHYCNKRVRIIIFTITLKGCVMSFTVLMVLFVWL